MPNVPEVPQFKSKVTNNGIYCFKPGASEADMQHDIAEVNKFIDYVRARHAKRKAKK